MPLPTSISLKLQSLHIFILRLLSLGLEVLSAGLHGARMHVLVGQMIRWLARCPKWVSYSRAYTDSASVWGSILPMGHLISPVSGTLSLSACFLVKLKAVL